MFGDRLQLARKKAGLSLRGLSDAMGGQVTPQALGKYERGEMMPGSTVLIALTKALDISMEFLAAPLEVRLGAIDFRKKSGTSARDRAHVEALVLERVERYLLVEEVLELKSAAWEPPFAPKQISTLEAAEALAMDLRSVWKLGIDPIPDVTELLEEKGIKVMHLELPDSVSGLTCMIERDGVAAVPVVVVNAHHGIERRRLTLIHELAHRLMIVEGIDEEKAANRFASAFLMPAPHVRDQVGKHRAGFGVAELMVTKKIYAVSAAALLVRFRDLEIITQQTMVYAFQSFARTWRKTEPQPIATADDQPREQPQRFQRLCYRALAEGLITISKAAELLRKPVAAIDEEMRGATVTDSR
ncbi:Zn-dependent peptidase ImmA, M78 family [Enhydrobacter aerosaccus]|uniref:Zn-dependent peptidase ImmA, M78 family n=1 Tax=Enhydrobacter aerosaccus TaxID=225324 RepID=A0A1T4SIN0_9HYPH|nr:XRE family transcriptional regulator [Enhydrobacter aerosaccus]SKA28005.1 Zn-dependent peptidase ImmA, M78 family [Enhydrobacter aerosaccus]